MADEEQIDEGAEEAPTFWELADEVALAALPGALAQPGATPENAATVAYLAAEHFLLAAKPAFIKRILAVYGEISVGQVDVSQHGV